MKKKNSWKMMKAFNIKNSLYLMMKTHIWWVQVSGRTKKMTIWMKRHSNRHLKRLKRLLKDSA
jgi:hypothetical protein